jgi:SAM-dependent methyltransferase
MSVSNVYLSGKKLIGDDYSIEEITQWYDAEVEGYANLGPKKKASYTYIYHLINRIHGFDKIQGRRFKDVLGFGSAYGDEFLQIVDRITNLVIIEPSDTLKKNLIGNIQPHYIKPEIDGTIKFPDNSFDLITSFGTLHHVPNVSFVISELIRVLRPGGYLLLREPIVSMGDWSNSRRGLTKNERGIPLELFDRILKTNHATVISRSMCLSMTSAIKRMLRKILKRNILTYKWYVYFDKFLSYLLSLKGLKYHPENAWDKAQPTNIFYVVTKGE